MPPLLSTSPPKNSSVPSVHGAALWADQLNKRLYLFGGEPPPSLPASNYYLPSLWSFDASLLNEGWALAAPKNNPIQVKIDGVSYGAGVSVEERGEGYYFGGWILDSSTGNATEVASGALVKFDFDEGQWSRNEGPDQGGSGKVGRAEGAMVFIPIGDGGMLVHFGGLMQTTADENSGNNVTTEGQPMELIYLYDVLSSKWYVQNATGEVPGKRRRFCAGATWAADKSSYNIYIYGGASTPPDNHPGYDDVYILTIPSFQWLKLYPSPSGNSDPKSNQQGGAYPHHSLTCNIISQAQMLIIGGTFPLSTDCDVPSQFGTHNLDLGEQNAKKEPWQLFNPNLTTYAVPDVVAKAVGGGKDGGATKREPEKGWTHPDLKVLLTREAKFAARTATRSVPSATSSSDASGGGKTLSKGAIAGIAVGGAVAIVAALVGACWFIRRHRQRRIRDQNSRREKPLADGARLGTVASHSNVPPWSPGMTATTGYTPTSPYSDGPFQRQQQEGSVYSASVPRLPAELEGNTYWQGPDGVMYELTSPGSVVAEQHQQGLQTKIDSQGRVWMQVPPAGRGDHGSPVSGPETVTETGSASGTPTTTAADRHGTEPPISPAHPPTEPQELGVNPKRGSADATTILMGSAGWDAARGRPKHHTFYHP